MEKNKAYTVRKQTKNKQNKDKKKKSEEKKIIYQRHCKKTIQPAQKTKTS